MLAGRIHVVSVAKRLTLSPSKSAGNTQKSMITSANHATQKAKGNNTMKTIEELEREAYISGNTAHADLLARIVELEGEVENLEAEKEREYQEGVAE